jgi:DNA-binding GntR family transcriptional regulator
MSGIRNWLAQRLRRLAGSATMTPVIDSSTLLKVAAMTTRTRRAPATHIEAGEAAEAADAAHAVPDSEARVYAALVSALLAGRLPPGTQLVERELAATFGATRGAVRKVLARLGAEGKLVLETNRGAFVPSPTEADIREVYRARQIVESGVIVALCGACGAQSLRRLRAHVRAEQKAQHAAQVDEAVRLAGQFHLLLTGLASGGAARTELHDCVARLVAKTELYKALFDPARGTRCAADEHAQIVDALESGDLPAALDAMRAHLGELEERVVRQRRRGADHGLAAAFSL